MNIIFEIPFAFWACLIGIAVGFIIGHQAFSPSKKEKEFYIKQGQDMAFKAMKREMAPHRRKEDMKRFARSKRKK